MKPGNPPLRLYVGYALAFGAGIVTMYVLREHMELRSGLWWLGGLLVAVVGVAAGANVALAVRKGPGQRQGAGRTILLILLAIPFASFIRSSVGVDTSLWFVGLFFASTGVGFVGAVAVTRPLPSSDAH